MAKIAIRIRLFLFPLFLMAGLLAVALQGPAALAGAITRYTVESFAIVEEQVAKQLTDSLKAQGLDPKILKRTSDGSTSFVVVVGTYLDKQQATNVQTALNRQKFMFVVSAVEVEVPSPELLSVSLEDEDQAMGAGPGDRIVFTFNIPIKLGSKVKTRGTLEELLPSMGVFSDLAISATDVALYERSERVVLVLGGLVKQEKKPSGVFVPSPNFVQDVYGQGVYNKTPVPLIGSFDDQRPPRLMSVVLEDGDGKVGAGVGDRIVFNFNKAVLLKGVEALPGLSGSLKQVLGYMGSFSRPGNLEADTAQLSLKDKTVTVLLVAGVRGNLAPSGEFAPSTAIRDAQDETKPIQEYPVLVKGTFNDRIAPTLTTIRLVDKAIPSGPGTGDLLILEYSETLNGTLFAKKRRSGPATALLGQLLILDKPGFEATQSTLLLEGRTITLKLGGKITGAYNPKSLKARPGSVQDTAGNAIAGGEMVAVQGSWRDTVAGLLTHIRLQDFAGDPGPGASDLLEFEFNKMVRVSTAKEVDACPKLQQLIGKFADGNLSSGTCKLIQKGNLLRLYLGPGTSLSGGVLPQLPFTAAPTLKDLAGNPVKPSPDLQLTGNFNDATPPRLVQVRFADQDSQTGFGKKDKIAFEFSENIDTPVTKGKFLEQTTLKSALLPLGKFEVEEGTDQVTVKVFVKGKWISFEKLEGPNLSPVSGSFSLSPGAVLDGSGNPSPAVTLKPQGSYNDQTPPRLVSVSLRDNDGQPGAGPGDTFHLVYNEPIALSPFPPEGLPFMQVLKPFGQFADGATLDVPKVSVSISGSHLILTMQAKGSFKSKDPKVSGGNPPLSFKGLKGLIKDTSGNVKVSEESVPVAGNFNDSKPPVLEMVEMKDGDRQGGIGKGDKLVLRFSEPIRLLVPVLRLSWSQFNRYIGRFEKGGPTDGTVVLTVQGSMMVATFQDTAAMAEEASGTFTPVTASFVDEARNPLEKGSVPITGTFSDKTAPRLLSVTLMDGDQKPQLGKGDSLLFEYSEPLTGSKSRALAKTATLGEILSQLGEFPGLQEAVKGKKVQALVQQAEVFVLMMEDSGVVVDTPAVFTPLAGSVDDNAGNSLSHAEPVKVKGSFKDGIPPKLLRVRLRDKDGIPGPGPGDTLTFEFSEQVKWLAQIPEKGLVKRVLQPVGSFANPRGFENVTVTADVSEKGLTLTVQEKLPLVKAPLGRFSLRGAVVQDMAGNTQLEPQGALVEGDFEKDVPPVLMSIRYQDNDQNGLITKDDRIFFEYSKPMEGLNLVKVGELTRLLGQLGETRLDRGFNASECWLTVRGGTLQILVGGKQFGESRIFDTFDSKSDVLRDAWQNPIKPKPGMMVLVQSGRNSKPLNAQASTVQVVALVQTYDSQNMAISLQDKLLSKEITSLIKTRMERGIEVYLVIAPLPEEQVRKDQILNTITEMGFSPSLILVSNRFVTP